MMTRGQNRITIQYKAIGVIHSEYTDKKSTPIQSFYSRSKGTVELFPEYAAGLKDIEGFSHIFLIYHFHQAEKPSLITRPFIDHKAERGIFAIRHYNRPNPIGISVVELAGVKNNVLEICGIDVLDGTPLLDIKPYISLFDRPENVRCGWFDERNIGSVKSENCTPEELEKR
jgi:tRNA-Thr(GGU) m(6)t(6)A37 methyltransferase TsaA